jgi:hypothetical protein
MSNYIYHPKGEALREYEPGIQKMFGTALGKHLGKVAIFTEADFDPETHPAQRMDVIGVEATVSNTTTLRFLVEQAFGEYTFQHYVSAFLASKQLLSDSIDLLASGKHVMLGTTHQRTDDIAAALAAFEVALLEFDTTTKAQYLTNGGIYAQLLIGKLITGLNAMGFYVPELLENIGGTYYTLPSGETFETSGIPETIRDDYNREILVHMEKDESLSGHGLLRAVALSGSTLVHTSRQFGSNRRQPQEHAGPIAHGTAVLMSRHHIVPIAMDIIGGRKHPPSLDIFPIVDGLTDLSEVHEIGHKLMRSMTTQTDVEHVYHPTREDFKEALRYRVGSISIPLKRKSHEI